MIKLESHWERNIFVTSQLQSSEISLEPVQLTLRWICLVFQARKLLHHFKSWCLLRYSKMQFKENKCVNLMQNRLRCCIFLLKIMQYSWSHFILFIHIEYTFVFKRLKLGLWHKENDSEFHQARSPHDTILPTNYSDIGAPSLTAHVDHKDTSLTKGR